MKISKRQRSFLRRILNYFFKGLLFIIPVAVTVSVLLWMVNTAASILPFVNPGIALILIIGSLTVIGYFGSGVLSKPFFDLFDDLMSRTPGLKLLYNLVKDMTEALVGEKRKFKEPVMVEFSSTGLIKLGFVTQKDLSLIQVDGYVAVYFPNSYAFSGDLFIVPIDRIKPVEGKTTQLMQFIVSGGVTELED